MASEKDIIRLEKTLKGCKIKKIVGKSHLGTLYLIHHSVYGDCVLKYFEGPILENRNFLKKLLREAKIAQEVEHPYCCRLYQVDY